MNRHDQLEIRLPLFPRMQTWIGPARAGKLGEFQRFSPGGLFGLSFNFLRMNQAETKLRSLFEAADFRDVEMATETHRFVLPSFDAYFEPFEQGAGSPGQAFVSLPEPA